MPTLAWLDGAVHVTAAIALAGFDIVAAPPAVLLVARRADAEAAIANAHKFADALPPGQEALVVNILQAETQDDWAAARAVSLLRDFTRHAALAWAPRRIRVNAIGLGDSAAPEAWADVAATILAMWRFPSMTGQLVRLGPP